VRVIKSYRFEVKRYHQIQEVLTMAYGGSGTAAAYAAIANAIKASGAIVRVGPEDFMTILSRTKDPLVVTARGGLFNASYRYLTGYKGLAFYTRSRAPLLLPGSAEVIAAKQIWIPA
jgi:hypothetical protein